MDWKLFNAVLAMDSYNRGYNPEATISFTGHLLGGGLAGFVA
jgi:hypothetical protein